MVIHQISVLLVTKSPRVIMKKITERNKKYEVIRRYPRTGTLEN